MPKWVAGSLAADGGAQNQAEQPAHNGEHDGAPESGAKAIDGEAITESEDLGQPGNEDEEDGIDDERHQSESQNVNRKSEKTQNATDGPVHQTEHNGNKEQRQKVAQTLLGLTGGHDNGNTSNEYGGEPEGDGVNDGRQEK